MVKNRKSCIWLNSNKKLKASDGKRKRHKINFSKVFIFICLKFIIKRKEIKEKIKTLEIVVIFRVKIPTIKA
jgi:hypothetical protein